MVIVDTVGAGAVEPAEERNAAGIVKELTRTIVRSQTALTRLEVEVTTGVDDDGLEV
jgi:hypothetical protein